MQQDDHAPFALDTPFRQVPALGPLLQSLTQRALAFERLATIYRQLGGKAAAPHDRRAAVSEAEQGKKRLSQRREGAKEEREEAREPETRAAEASRGSFAPGSQKADRNVSRQDRQDRQAAKIQNR
jgi:hypothetical protein